MGMKLLPRTLTHLRVVPQTGVLQNLYRTDFTAVDLHNLPTGVTHLQLPSIGLSDLDLTPIGAWPAGILRLHVKFLDPPNGVSKLSQSLTELHIGSLQAHDADIFLDPRISWPPGLRTLTVSIWRLRISLVCPPTVTRLCIMDEHWLYNIGGFCQEPLTNPFVDMNPNLRILHFPHTTLREDFLSSIPEGLLQLTVKDIILTATPCPARSEDCTHGNDSRRRFVEYLVPTTWSCSIRWVQRWPLANMI
jgi:hypothetical protein